jgi:hypothetical protein
MEQTGLFCPKCDGNKWVQYDHNHTTICDACCTHSAGWWLLSEHYGEDNGKLCCITGCGTTRENNGEVKEYKRF